MQEAINGDLGRDHIGHTTKWRIDKYTYIQGSKLLYQIDEFSGNIGLNEGIAVLTSLLTGGTDASAFGTDSMMGVGNGTAVAAASQTGLQGASKLYVAMETTDYPSVSGQAISWKASYATDEANFEWEEFTVSNNTDDTGQNLVRKVESRGTKVSGEQWDLTLTVTFS
jgi:hypothetical protein